MNARHCLWTAVFLMCASIAGASTPVARWDVVPDQVFDGEFQPGVCAFHAEGVKVEFRIGGSLVFTAEQPTLNDASGVWEYWCPLVASQYADGPILLEARAVPLASGHASYDLPPLSLYANSQGTLTVGLTNWVDSVHGDDANPGTVAAPFQTLAKAVQSTPAGGTVNLLPGAYSSHALGGGPGRPYWTTVQAAPGVDREAVEIGPGRPSTQRLRWRNVTLYCDHAGSYTAILTGENGSQSVWLDDCKTYNKQGRWAANANVFGNRYISYVTGGITTELMNGPSASLIRGHTVERIGSDVWTGSGKLVVNSVCRDVDPGTTGAHPDFYQSTGTLEAPYSAILYNVAGFECKAQGLFGDHLKDSAFVNVLFEQAPAAGYYSQVGTALDNVLYLHVQVVKQGWWVRGLPTGVCDAAMVNCLFSSMSEVDGGQASLIDIDACHFGQGGYGTQATTGDPLYRNADGNDFNLMAGSPARGTGVPLQCVPADINGRPYGRGGRNRGCHAVESGDVGNGSFEEGMEGWLVASSNTNAPACLVTPSQGVTGGMQALALGTGNAAGNARLAQTLATVSGVVYTVRFDYGAFGAAGRQQRLLAEIVAGDAVLASATVTANGPGNYVPASTTFQGRTLAFTAISVATTLRFSDQTTEANSLSCDGMLDAVSLSWEQVALPTFSAASATYAAPVTVMLASATSRAVLRYTLDGSEPTASHGEVYAGPLLVSVQTTLKAVASKAGMVDSLVSSATYAIGGEELLSNTGFEADVAGWSANGGNIARTTSWCYAGAGSCKSYLRTAGYCGPRQTIKAALLAHGPGDYNVASQLGLAWGNDTGRIQVGLKVGGVWSYPTVTGSIPSGGWGRVVGTLTLTWTGTLEDAVFFVNTADSTADLYVDDCSLRKAIDGPPPGGEATVVNGSFEDAATDWVLASNDGGAVAATVLDSQGATDGTSALALGTGNAAGNAVLQQVLATTAGVGYAVEFRYGAFGASGKQQQLRVEVLDGTTVLASVVVSAYGPGNYLPSNTTFQAYTLAFAATSATTTLRFTDLTTLANSVTCDGMLDQVELRVVDDLPSPWLNVDIGAVGVAGGAVASSGVFTVEGAGADIWGTSDAFQFVYQTASGDCEIKARVATLENTDPWAKAGVMVRETLNANSMHAMAVLTPSNGANLMYRNSTGGSCGYAQSTGKAAPYWVRVVRSGNSFTAYHSPDGSTWTQVGAAQTIAMGTSVHIGLCVTSHDDTELNTSTLDSVTVTP